MTVLLKNALVEAVNIINFIISQPWILLNLFNILYCEMEIMHKTFLLYAKVWWLPEGKALVWLSYELK